MLFVAKYKYTSEATMFNSKQIVIYYHFLLSIIIVKFNLIPLKTDFRKKKNDHLILCGLFLFSIFVKMDTVQPTKGVRVHIKNGYLL